LASDSIKLGRFGGTRDSQSRPLLSAAWVIWLERKVFLLDISALVPPQQSSLLRNEIHESARRITTQEDL
jgi:hypothetical protein